MKQTEILDLISWLNSFPLTLFSPILFHATPAHPSLSSPPFSHSGYVCLLSFSRAFTSLTGSFAGIRKRHSSRWLKFDWFVTVGVRKRYPFLWLDTAPHRAYGLAGRTLGWISILSYSLGWVPSCNELYAHVCKPACPLLAGSAHLQQDSDAKK